MRRGCANSMNVNEAIKVVNRCDDILRKMIESEAESYDDIVFKLTADEYFDLKQIIQRYRSAILDTELVKDMW